MSQIAAWELLQFVASLFYHSSIGKVGVATG
jgi:hypothetical protein